MLKVTPGTHGGRRKGSGRKAGIKNKATVARELLASASIAAVMEKLAPEDVERLNPLEIMTIAMRVQMAAGDLMAAVSVAERLAPYLFPKRAHDGYAAPRPSDLEPDPVPTPDSDDVPEHPVLG